jgi:hypothetical protein
MISDGAGQKNRGVSYPTLQKTLKKFLVAAEVVMLCWQVLVKKSPAACAND